MTVCHQIGSNYVIISRYLLKEVLSAFLAITCVLVLIFLCNQLVRYLSYAAQGKIAATFVLQMLAYKIPNLLALLLPLSFYLAIIVGFGKLYAESELPVLKACGFGAKRLIYVTYLLATPIAIIVLVLMLWVNPYLAVAQSKGLANDSLLGTIRPGRFETVNNGRNVIYVEKISRNHKKANNLFIAEEPKNVLGDSGAWVIVSANSAALAKNKLGQKFIVSTDGYRYDGTPGQNNYKIIAFKKYAVRLPDAPLATPREEEEAIPTGKLIKHLENPAFSAEFAWRIAMPLSVFILMLIAIPLSRIKPRQGRYTQLIPALLIYIVYVNLLFMARSWVEQKIIPTEVGMWPVHLFMLSLGIVLISYEQYQFQILRLLKNLRKKS